MNNPETFYCDPAKVPYREKNSNRNSLPWIDEDLHSMLLQFAESSFWVNLVSDKKKITKSYCLQQNFATCKNWRCRKTGLIMKGDCRKKHNIALHSTCFAASCETSCTFCYKVVLVSQAKGLANFTINCILYVYKHLKKLLTYVTSHTKMFLTVCRFRTDSHIYLTHVANLLHLKETRNTQHITASCSKIS